MQHFFCSNWAIPMLAVRSLHTNFKGLFLSNLCFCFQARVSPVSYWNCGKVRKISWRSVNETIAPPAPQVHKGIQMFISPTTALMQKQDPFSAGNHTVATVVTQTGLLLLQKDHLPRKRHGRHVQRRRQRWRWRRQQRPHRWGRSRHADGGVLRIDEWPLHAFPHFRTQRHRATCDHGVSSCPRLAPLRWQQVSTSPHW